ncbi:MAG: hypothetical protein JWP18_2202 [Solirubrobacterales bacterium]|nr:hypothetical protein [Solirubrobacterales bacterium]
MRTITATRYVTPFREGGSMPALVEADDDGLYVLKFRGAGQGPRALVAELLAGELARALGLPVPEVVLCELDPRVGVAEPDPEIQELLQASAGLNVALDFLPGSLAFTDPATVDPARAADIVWLDSLVMNVDRTPRNPNLLRWHGATWLIDHGAAFYRHHRDDSDPVALAVQPFGLIADHVLLPRASSLREADARLRGLVDEALLERLGALVPDGWADPEPYVAFLRARVAASAAFAQEADDARP